MHEFCDEYEHNESEVEYILENVLMPDDGSPEFKILRDNFNSQLTLSCSCNEANKCCHNNGNCCHGGCFTCNSDGELVLSKGYPAIIECNDLCKCKINLCDNRKVQYGPRRNLEIFNSPLFKSKGLRTLVDIPRGAFICEYAGELLTRSEASRRLEEIDKYSKMNYILCLREYTKLNVNPTEITIVDPSRYGNIGRYLNHSCQPNCEIFAVRINCPIPKIGIFAKKDIATYEELCFHYGGEETNKDLASGNPCLCGASNCAGVVPNLSI